MVSLHLFAWEYNLRRPKRGAMLVFGTCLAPVESKAENARANGEVAERLNALVLKTSRGLYPLGGSNPPLSAIILPG